MKNETLIEKLADFLANKFGVSREIEGEVTNNNLRADAQKILDLVRFAGYISMGEHNAEIEKLEDKYDREIERLIGLELVDCQKQKQEIWEDMRDAVALEKVTGIPVSFESIRHKRRIE